RASLVGIVVLLVVALIAGALAVDSRNVAKTAAVRADADRLAGLGASEGRLEVALLAAAEGVRLRDSTGTRAGLLTALQRAPRALRVVRAAGATVPHLDPTGRTLAVEMGTGAEVLTGNTVRLFRAADLSPRGSYQSAPATGYLADGRFATTEYDRSKDT